MSQISTASATGQTPHDCKIIFCDANGNASVTMDNDPPLPVNDCSMGVCAGATPMQIPLMADHICSSNGGKVCDGSGACVQCNTSAQCGASGVCMSHTCSLIQPCLNDMTKNGGETDVDCGGPTSCMRCAFGQTCFNTSDCAAPLTCTNTICQ